MNTQEIFKEVARIQKIAAKRGLELIYAAGAKWKYYTTPDFSFSETGVYMSFGEDTSHDCPESEGITLSIEEIEMNDADWAVKIEQTKAEAKRKQEEAEQKEKDDTLAEKKRQLERLKTELGEA